MNFCLKFHTCELTPNNFDLLRFIFSVTVFFNHTVTLSKGLIVIPLSSFLSAEIAVKAFFVLSGFLIFMSYEKSDSLKSYFFKRVNRIYPAYFFVITFFVFVCAFFSKDSWTNYWSIETFSYLVANLTFANFLHPNLPGLFINNSISAVNGALWTLKIEVMFYFFVPIISLCFKRHGHLLTMISLFFISVLYSAVLFHLHLKYKADFFLDIQRQFPGQLTFFLIGAAGYYYFEYFKRYSHYLFFVALIAVIFKVYLPWLIFEPIVLGIMVIYFGLIFPCLGHFSKFGDFSYGIYILHFPILQLLISNHILEDYPILFLILASLTVLISSVFLWIFVEKPFLKKSSHYIT